MHLKCCEKLSIYWVGQKFCFAIKSYRKKPKWTLWPTQYNWFTFAVHPKPTHHCKQTIIFTKKCCEQTKIFPSSCDSKESLECSMERKC